MAFLFRPFLKSRGASGGWGASCEVETAHRSLGNGVREKGVRNRVRIDDVWSILKFRISFTFGENSAGFASACGFRGRC